MNPSGTEKYTSQFALFRHMETTGIQKTSTNGVQKAVDDLRYRKKLKTRLYADSDKKVHQAVKESDEPFLSETDIRITLLVYPLLPRTSLHSITWNQQHSDGI